jgi:lipid II:glycine glycyltransferase (peptidoglycan interpeptide bridge formation enzyme)
MINKGVDLLFSTKDEFISFTNRNLKNIIITICFKGDEISYFNVVYTNRKVATYIMAVTTNIGMSSYASYMGIYELYNYLHRKRFKILNFGGVDPVNNHGVYLFKKGFSGELLESPSYMIVGTGLTAWTAKRMLHLKVLINSK